MMSRIAKAYQSDTSTKKVVSIIIISIVLVVLFIGSLSNSRSNADITDSTIDTNVWMSSLSNKQSNLDLLTWNIAAINNNPFEYWITNDDPAYNSLMMEASKFIDNPGDKDVLISTIFTDDMYNQLELAMKSAGFTGLEETKKLWDNDYKHRKMISGFIKDGSLGKKRLASMPDRVTNTISLADESVITRPTVINCYDGKLDNIELWYKQWLEFMFTKKISIRKGDETKETIIIHLLQPIKSSKYPAITAEEEAISIPLQTLCQALFDCILVSMMNTIGSGTWQGLREDMCNKLNRHKLDRTIDILQSTYATLDVQFLQEVGKSFISSSKNKKLSLLYDIHYPSTMDGERDQNSFILLKKNEFTNIQEVTIDVLNEFKDMKLATPPPIMNGDLLALTAYHTRTATKYLLASFHGDTNGLATVPIVDAMNNYATTKKTDHKLLFGMDANTYAHPDADQQGVTAFASYYVDKKMNTCYGEHPNPLNFTTFHARTHLQTQLNKAVKFEDKDVRGDKNPKDFILFYKNDFSVISTKKDNTGDIKYIENMVFPTLVFPSDHGITSTTIVNLPPVSSSSSLRRSNAN